MDLSQQTRRLLKDVNDKLKRQPRVLKSVRLKSIQALQAWCVANDIPTSSWITYQHAQFTASVMQQIERRLNVLQLAPLEIDYANLNRQQQADAGLDEKKQSGEKPNDYRVLVASPQQLCLPAVVDKQTTINVDCRDINVDYFERLMVVENLDSFYQVFSNHPQRYQLPKNINEKTLVLYRGHNQQASNVVRIREQFLVHQKPCIYFGDFDSKGIHIALSEGYQYLLLPTLEYMQQQANVMHSAAKQLPFLTKIRHTLSVAAGTNIEPLLALHVNQQKSLKQQWFKGRLQLWALPSILPPTPS